MFASRSQFFSQPAQAAGGFGNSALFPNVSDQYLRTAGATNLVNWKASTGFTIEYWLYSVGNFPGSIQGGPGNSDGSGTNYWTFGPINTNRLQFYYWGAGTSYIQTDLNTIFTNTWTNVSMVATSVGTSTTVSLYINGIRTPIQLNNSGTYELTKTVTNGVNSAGTVFGMGKYGGNLWNNLYMDNLRVSNVNRYSGDSYALATAPFESDPSTQLLLTCDGTPGSTVITDSSSFARTMFNISNRVTISATHANHS